MITDQIVDALLEADQVDPKKFADKIPPITVEAIEWAKNQFNELWSSGNIRGPRHADETMSDLASDACAEFELEDEDSEEEILTELYKYSAELVKGVW